MLQEGCYEVTNRIICDEYMCNQVSVFTMRSNNLLCHVMLSTIFRQKQFHNVFNYCRLVVVLSARLIGLYWTWFVIKGSNWRVSKMITGMVARMFELILLINEQCIYIVLSTISLTIMPIRMHKFQVKCYCAA